METLRLTANIKNRALFVQENHNKNDLSINVPVFPVHNLWYSWNNVILYTNFSDYLFVKNLYTKHKKIFYVYDLNWHIDSISYKNTIEAFAVSDYLIARSEWHANKIEEYCGRRPLIITDINLESIINECSSTLEHK